MSRRGPRTPSLFRRSRAAALALVLASVPFACTNSSSSSSDGGETSDGAKEASLVCAPGQQINCGCPGGLPQGVQVCNSDGSGYDPCECEDASLQDSALDGTVGETSPPDSASDVTLDQQGASDVIAQDVVTPDSERDAPGPDAADSTAQEDSGTEGGPDATVDGPSDASSSSDGPSDASSSGDGSPPVCTAPPAPQCPAGTFEVTNAASVTMCATPGNPQYGCGPNQGSCGGATPHALMACSGTTCVDSCIAGYADCNGLASDGCEADLTSAATCGSCTTACGTGQMCVNGGCVSTCDAPYTNCAGTCFDLQNDAHACGSCNKTCDSMGPGAICSGGVCSCAPGFTLCSGSCVQTDSTSYCGSGCASCGSPLNPVQCVNGLCQTAPLPSYDQLCAAGCPTGQTCVTNGSCPGGCCTPQGSLQLVTGLMSPGAILVDATNVYWTDSGDDTVNEALKSTGVRQILANTHAGSFAINDSSVFWVDQNTGNAMLVPIGGGMAQTIGNVGASSLIAADATSLYWATSGSGPGVYAMPITGGPARTVYTPPLPCIAALVANGFGLYGGNLFGMSSNCVFEAFSTGGGNILTDCAACGATWSYLGANEYGVTAQSDPVNGGPKVSVLAGAGTGGSFPQGTAIGAAMTDGCSLYAGSGTMLGWLGPSLVLPLVKGVSVQSVAVDATYVYWADGSGYIGRVNK